MNLIESIPTPVHGAESRDAVESIRFKLSVLATLDRCLFVKTVRWTNS